MFPGGRRKSEHMNSFPLPTPQSDELADWRAPWAAVVSPLGFREFALGSNSFGPAQDGHRAIPPDAVFLVSQSINMKQQPSRLQQPVNFRSAASLNVVAGYLHNV